MTTWGALRSDAPEFAARVRAVFEAGTNKTLATLRADGSPRISGSELAFDDDHVTLGMMPDSRKLADVERDPRVALHSPTLEPPPGSLGAGDAKLAGALVAIAVPEGGAPGAYFELQISEAVVTTVQGDELVVESWHPGRGVEVVRRR
jgi:hypothetical protein